MTRRCMTCRRDFAEGDPKIHHVLEAFEDTCICLHCVQVYRKEVPPDPDARE